MHGYFKICNTVYWLAIMVWFAAIVSAGVAAGNVFSTLDELNLTLGDYQAYQPEAADGVNPHGRLAAGMVMEGVFFLVNVLQFAAIPVVALTLLLQLTVFGQRLTRAANLIRTLCLVAAMALFAWHGLVQAPRMNHELRAYWQAAKIGDLTAAAEHQDSFIRDHPLARNILNLNLLLVLIAAGASASALGPTPVEPKRSPTLEEPALLHSP